MFKETNVRDFQEDTSSGLVLVEIFNPGCVPCEQLRKEVLPLAEDHVDKILTLNASENVELIIELQKSIGAMMSVPILLLFEGGDYIARKDGMMSGDNLIDFIS